MATAVREGLQDEFLSTLRKGQEIALDALKTLVETIQSVTPSMPAVRVPLADRLVPLADRLPGPHEVVARASDFAEQLLANQRQFADEMITAASPLLPGTEGAHAAKADKPADKPAAKAGKPAAKAGKSAAK
jgi:hypothetical protein